MFEVKKTGEATDLFASVIEHVGSRRGDPDVELERRLKLLARAFSAFAEDAARARQEAAREVERHAIAKARGDRYSEEARTLTAALESERARRVSAENRLHAAREWMRLKRVDFASAELAGEGEAA